MWDNCNGCHHDGIHCFFGATPQHFSGSYIYDNRFDGTVGTDTTAWIFLEPNAGSICDDSSSRWYIFNNVFSSTDVTPTNPYVEYGHTLMYNNTFDGPGVGHYGVNQTGCVDPTLVFENNAVGGCASLMWGAGTQLNDYNAYAENTSNNCFPTVGCNFAAWQAAGHDQHGVYNGSMTTGSNASGVGANLTSLCVGDLVPLCSDINGNARPTSGAWTAGAVG